VLWSQRAVSQAWLRVVLVVVLLELLIFVEELVLLFGLPQQAAIESSEVGLADRDVLFSICCAGDLMATVESIKDFEGAGLRTGSKLLIPVRPISLGCEFSRVGYESFCAGME
jgi:hypothetical protein